MSELIDTLWNVNYEDCDWEDYCGSELIDTLWNVNIIDSDFMNSRTIRINRYIMECKLQQIHCLNLPVVELIDTLWNVNINFRIVVYHNVTGINRYIMECK